MMRGQTVYKALLYCYPAAFRHEYGIQMQLAFDEQMGEARRAGTRLRRAGLWLEAARDALTIAPKEHWHVIRQDLRYAFRTMAARPAFTAVAVLSLALGIGANTAIFSLWNSVLHSSLPGVYRPNELVILSDPESSGQWHGNSQGEREWLTYSEFQQLRDHATSFSSMMASESSLDHWQVRFNEGASEEVRGRLVSGGYFHLLGVRPIIGITFASADDAADAPYAVISYTYWQRRFGGRPDVLGRTFTLRNAVLTITGVTPPGFIGETAGQQPDLWIPLTMQPRVVPGEDWLHDSPPEKVMWLHVFGRLKPRVTPSRAAAEANAIFKAGLQSYYGAIAPEHRREYLDQTLKIRPGSQGASTTRGDFSTSLNTLLVAVGLLLLIACANLANLLVAHGAARRPEIALRMSLGASRRRLIRQLLTESLFLSAIGGAVGLALAWFIHSALVGMIVQSERNFQTTFSLDPLLLVFTLAVTVAAALLFGLLPAWQLTRTDLGIGLKEQSRAGAFLGKMRLGRSLVSLQLALSLPLLAGAALLARTVYNLQHVQLGYPADRLLLVGINSRVAGYNSARSGVLFRELLDRVRRIPGVQAASFSHNGVFTGSNSGDEVSVEGYTPKGDSDRGSSWDMVGPDYFSTLGIPILLGRGIFETDHAAAPKVCVINEAFAKQFFAGRNPIGMHITVIDEDAPVPARMTYQVVGVAKDARTNGLRGKIAPRFYEPFAQPHGDNVKRANFLIRTTAENVAVLAAVRRSFERLDASLPILYARSIGEQIAPSTATERTTAQVAVAFGCVALALAAIGVYGVLSYSIARRRNEIAIRIALGARPGRVVRMVLRETTTLVVAGLILGAALTYAAARLISTVLYGVITFATVLLLLVALSAAYLPAQRASRLDPMVALRQE